MPVDPGIDAPLQVLDGLIEQRPVGRRMKPSRLCAEVVFVARWVDVLGRSVPAASGVDPPLATDPVLEREQLVLIPVL